MRIFSLLQWWWIFCRCEANKFCDSISLQDMIFEEIEFAAIIECKVGLGKAILSGVHFEYDPKFLDPNDTYLIPIIENMKSQNENRLELVRALLERLIPKTE